jgi:thioredoxin reductase
MSQNNVTLSYRSHQFAIIKTLNTEKINKAIAEKKLNVLFNSNPLTITNDAVIISRLNTKEEITIDNDLVYIFAGGELPTAFLESVGVQITKRFGQIVKKHK